MPSAPQKQSLRYAFANILESTEHGRHLAELILMGSLELSKHPFGFELMKHHFTGDTRIFVVNHPGDTDASLRGIKVALRSALASWTNSRQDRVPIRLRIIKTEQGASDLGSVKKHCLWFEVQWRSYHFICSGCNDFSGRGGNGGTELMQVFAELTALDDVSLETVTIPFPKSVTMEKAVFVMMDAFDKAS